MEHYLIAMAVTAGIYAIMALVMNVIWGMAGLINLGLVGFFAVGAYASALLTLKFGWSIAAGVIAAMIVTSLVGAVVAFVTVNLRGDYLAIVTLGFAESMRIVMSNEIWLANGTDGLSGIPGPMRQQLGPHGFNALFLGIVVVVTLILFVLAERLAHSPFGRAALGLGGALYGHFTSYIAPDLFEPLLTLYVILALLAGGLGNNKGAVFGAVVVVFFLEGTRFAIPMLPFMSAVQGAALRQLLIAVALLVILRFYTQGLIPEKIQQPALPDAVASQAEIDDVKA